MANPLQLLRYWDQLVDCICRPPRDEYQEQDLLGGKRGVFKIGNRRFKVRGRVGRRLLQALLLSTPPPPP